MAKWDDNYIVFVCGLFVYLMLILLPKIVGRFLRSRGEESQRLSVQDYVKGTESEKEAAEERAALLRRCEASYKNGWEGLTVYMSAVTVAVLQGPSATLVNATCLVMLAARLAHVLFYLFGKAAPLSYGRSVSFLVQLIACAVTFIASMHRGGNISNSYIVMALSVPFMNMMTFFPGNARLRHVLKGEKLKELHPEPRLAVANFAESDHEKAAFVRRGTACHENGWETYLLFITTATVCAASGAKFEVANAICIGHIVMRAAYTVCYLKIGQPVKSLFRTTCFLLALGCIVALWVVTLYNIKVELLAAALATPVMYLCIMVPIIVRGYLLSSRDMLVESNGEPRRAAEAFANSDDPSAPLMRRVIASHARSWEALSLLASALISGLYANVDHVLLTVCLIVFLSARVSYTATSLISDAHAPRALVSVVSVACVGTVWVAALCKLA
eukprot:Rhum_TRINITY_DN22907_c0_g1::Rhum_TRINITY_DN22907_c0_g1_i1::g.176550::m.176550